MIQKMQRRFSVLVLLGLFLIIGGFVFTINYVNSASLSRQAQNSLHLLLAADGKRPAFEAAPGTDSENPAAAERGPFFQSMPGQPPDDRTFFTSLSNFYTVRLDENGEISEWFSDRRQLYTEAHIREITDLALEKDGDFGRIGSQYYAKAQQQDGVLLVFLDARVERENTNRLLISTLLAGLGIYLVMSLGALLLIRRITRPVQEAFDKQKQFVADASHELKTPLAVISANAEALAGETGESRWLDYIRSEVQRTDLLVKNLLTLAQLDSDQSKKLSARFDLSQAVLSVALPFESAAFESGKHLDLDVQEALGYTGDEEMIKQLVVILLGNALKYSNEGSRISLSLKKEDRRVLRVCNTGESIPKEVLSRVFERFYRVDPSRNRENAGHGMGLAIAKTIVEAHKGKIFAESEPGGQVCFTVLL